MTTKRKMTSPEEREKRLRRLHRNKAARSLRNFKPQRIENKKKRQKYEPEDDVSLEELVDEEYDVRRYLR